MGDKRHEPVRDDTPAIALRGISKRFSDVTALENVDLEMASGKILGFLGPNGAGKTTTIRILTGFLKPTAGTVRLLGYDMLDRAAALAQKGRPDGQLIAECAQIKLDVVERDPSERGERKLLNLGHTFGHGVEAAGRFSRFAHGESIAIGLSSLAFAVFVPNVPWLSGVVYFLMGPAHGFNGFNTGNAIERAASGESLER